MDYSLSSIPLDMGTEVDADDTLEANDRDCEETLYLSAPQSVAEVCNNGEAEADPNTQMDAKKEDTPAAILKPSGADKQKRINMRANALRSISSFNAGLNHERQTERKTFFDTQTFAVHYSCVPRSKRIQREPGRSFECQMDDYARYPVALLHGQFAGPYKRFTCDELKYLPLRSVLHRLPRITNCHAEKYDDKVELRLSNEEDRELFEEVLNAPDDVEESDNESEAPTAATRKRIMNGFNDSTRRRDERNGTDSASKGHVETISVDCALCTRKCTRLNVDSVRCAICKRVAHFACFYITSPLLRSRVSRYAWQCMECKQCEKCGGNENENLLIVCDRCDRTFHTFCLELPEIPTGSWSCPVCVDEAATGGTDHLHETALGDDAQDELNDELALLKAKSNAKKSKRSKRSFFTSPRRSAKRARNGTTPSRNASAFSLDSLISGVIEESVSTNTDVKPVQPSSSRAKNMAALPLASNGVEEELSDGELEIRPDTKSNFEEDAQANASVLTDRTRSAVRPQRARKPNVTLSFLDSPPRKSKRLPPAPTRDEPVTQQAIPARQQDIVAITSTPAEPHSLRTANRSRSRQPPSRPKSSVKATKSRTVEPAAVKQIDIAPEFAASKDVADMYLEDSEDSVSLMHAANGRHDSGSGSSTPRAAGQQIGNFDLQYDGQLHNQLDEQRHSRQIGMLADTVPPPLHPILSATFGGTRAPLDLTSFSRRTEEEVRISKIPSSTYSCSQVDTVAGAEIDCEQDTAVPLDLTCTVSRRSTPPISPTISLRIKQ